MLSKTKHLRALLLGATLSAGLITLTVVPPTAIAQTSKGTLTGIVRDSSGAVVPNVEVTIINVETGESRVVKTSSLGAYRLDAVTPGHYTLRAETTGFERFEAKNLTVTPSQLVSFDVALNPGHVNETVSVSATSVLLDEDNGSLSTTISGETLAKVPIFSLNPIEIATTVPGVQIVSNSNFTNGEDIQVSGARPRANNFMIDGEEINDATIAGQAVQPQIPDMYSDVIVYTHNPPAEFGRASGGVVNLITKGGTNTYHGSAWDLYSGSGLNAVDGQTRQLVPKSRADKGRYDEQQFGFTAGGAIIKNKLFGFGAAQYSRYYGNETASQVNLPNAAGVALLNTLASGSGTVATNAALILKYLSNASYLSNYLDYSDDSASLGSPTAPVPEYLGAACPVSTPNCYIGIDLLQRPPTPEVSPDTQWTYRIDYTPEAKDTFTARYLHDRQSLTPDFFTNGASLPGFDTYQGGPSELGQGTWTHIFSPRFLNEFRASETRLSIVFAPTAQTLANPLYTNPNLTFNSGAISEIGFNQGFPQGRGQDMYQFQDTITWTHGRQSVRAGADVGRRIETDLNGLNLHGNLTFNNGGTGNSDLGNFLLNQLGPSGTATIDFGSPRVDPHSWRSGVFAQDDIKVYPDFTINVGIRWDFFTNPDNSLPYPAIDPSSATTLYGPIDTVYKVAENRHSFAPRVGFAYTPHLGNWFADGKTVIRAGFGVFFDPEFTNITDNSAGGAPNIASGELQQTLGNGLSNATGLISQISPQVSQFSTVESVVKNLTTPYTPEWNLGIERELPGQIGISVTYVGSRGIKLFANQQYNYDDFYTGNRLNTTRGVIDARGNFADSDYNGLEVGVRHNFGHGLTLNGEYVYSKSLDDGSEIFAPDSAPTSYDANLAPGGRGLDWGNSTFDHRQYAAFNYVWTPSGLHADTAALNAFLGAATRHWTISGSSRFQTGAYSTVNFAGLDSNGDGSAFNDRPVLSNKKMPMSAVGIDGIYLGAPTPGTYYDLAALDASNTVTQVDPSTERWLIPYGPQFLYKEIGRDSYLNPGLLYNDVALEKAIPTSLLHLDRGQFVFRAEVQDFANHNNINLLNVNLLYVGTSSFMNPAEARETESRNLRFWMKYTF